MEKREALSALITVLAKLVLNCWHGCTASGGHELPKVSIGPAMPDPSMPKVRKRRPKMIKTENVLLNQIAYKSRRYLQPFLGWRTRRAGWPTAVFYPFGHPTPYAYGQSHGQKDDEIYTNINIIISNHYQSIHNN
jgi:hypothetical protein